MIHCLISMPIDSVQWRATFVYGANDQELRKELWDDLRGIHVSVNTPWLILGDFNCCLDPSEKLGGNQVDWEAMEDFRACVQDCRLQDMRFCGNLFTWCNRQLDGNRIYKLRMRPQDPELHQKEKILYGKYMKALNDSISILKQKAKEKWIQEGDQNTAFFHNAIRSRQYRNHILSITKDDGSHEAL
ncbi:hypothetical protein RIF29_38645 [Crotalaria pallida]|uniref:Endonuclease/exonuclease/phosphatase domain-containing protein n=1 Tax=Crotalaria pallida TaxID=3830 RepID=A0AAN9E2P6_CROPI